MGEAPAPKHNGDGFSAAAQPALKNRPLVSYFLFPLCAISFAIERTQGRFLCVGFATTQKPSPNASLKPKTLNLKPFTCYLLPVTYNLTPEI